MSPNALPLRRMRVHWRTPRAWSGPCLQRARSLLISLLLQGAATMVTTRSRIAIVTLALGASTLSGCALTQSNAGKGAIIGAATGAAAGAAVGSKNGGTARGAIIGAAIGGAAGTIIGHQMDKQAKEIAQNIPGATVERVGEGIQVTFASGLLYDYDSDRVRADAASNLRTLAQSLDKYPDTELLIVGHTDDRGTDEY